MSKMDSLVNACGWVGLAHSNLERRLKEAEGNHTIEPSDLREAKICLECALKHVDDLIQEKEDNIRP